MPDTARMAWTRRRTAAGSTSAGSTGGTLLAEPGEQAEPAGPARPGLRSWWPVLLVRAAHPGQALVTALLMAAAALLAGREAREAMVVLATVLVGQAVLGWHNDLLDRGRDARHQPGKPLVGERLDPGTVWFSLLCGVLLLVPLAIATGVVAGLSYLIAVAVALLGERLLRRGRLSWLPWAVSFALLPAYLSYGGWGGQALGPAPSWAMTLLAALLGVGVHLLRSTYGLVADHEEHWRSLPVRLGLRLGAASLLRLSAGGTVLVALAMAVVGSTGGLAR